jgi:uncharacterized protein (DUF488 family)
MARSEGGLHGRENSRIYTVGHSTRSISEFLDILKHYGIQELVDIRTIPRSRKNPQFNLEDLERVLPGEGINYTHMENLGGLRRPGKDSPNGAWRNDSFRGFADYMQTPEFAEAISRLVEIAARRTTAIMCAETLPWRCHRSLVADAMILRGSEVIEIFDMNKSQPHKLTPFAVVEGQRLTYPPSDS